MLDNQDLVLLNTTGGSLLSALGINDSSVAAGADTHASPRD